MLDITRSVLVTGASRGIGAACALELAGPGVLVGVNYHTREAEAQVVLAGIEQRGGRGVLLPADVADPNQVREIFDRMNAHAGRLDVLVANAGVVSDSLAMRLADQEWRRVIATNLDGAFYCVRAALRPMLRQRSGRVVAIGSVVGVRGNAGQANYAAAKAGLAGMAKAVAREVASRNITVNVVAPGFIETEMTAAMSEEARRAMLSAVPMGRAGTPEEVATLVGFLAGEKAGYITGQVFIIDGGLAI